METGRRKSCDACVRAKRRCQLGRPQCRRCLLKNIECVYPVSTPASASIGATRSQAVAFTDVTGSSISGTPAPSMNGAWFEFCNEPFNLPALPENILFDTNFVGDTVSPQHTYLFDRSSDVYARSEFVSKRLAQIPKSFVEQAQTSFIHRGLLQRPVLQDALSVAALYFFRNDSNRLVANRTLEHKAQLVIQTTNPQALNRSGLLEATQALLIYQLIRLFDGDIRLRAQAEADEPVLTSWAEQLRSSMQPATGESSLASSPNTDMEWHSWLLEESIRRTVIVAFMLKGIYHYLKTGRDSEQDLRLSFNAQGSLWDAQSQRRWAAIRNQQANMEVRVLNWNDDIGKASPDDLEDLGVQIMTMLWGVDMTAQWLAKDNLLERYGFDGA